MTRGRCYGLTESLRGSHRGVLSTYSRNLLLGPAMSSTRRDFLQVSASTAAAFALGPLTRDAHAELPPTLAVSPLQPKAIRARPVHLSKIRLTGGPLKAAQDSTAKYLLSLEPD